ncbi:hypothetical protein F8M41_025661 [Gigaspora margarita]|uniref:Uncharacterized protein n=1 Tax=Gigaspora margarita TaxID=4874 RepID=A0A8H4AB27_GIGMA|nr:hypothetical protein F8M41_025661 [Gigaspora margarita]
MSITVESSAVSRLLVMELFYENYFVFITYKRWTLPHYIATIHKNYKDTTIDKAYHCFFKTLEQFADDLDTAKEICEVSNALIKKRRMSNNYV